MLYTVYRIGSSNLPLSVQVFGWFEALESVDSIVGSVR